MWLTKRQQQVLRRMHESPRSEYTDFVHRTWTVAVPDQALGVSDVEWFGRYGDLYVSSRTMRVLFDAGLVAMGWRHDGANLVAALTPRGRRLAELLP